MEAFQIIYIIGFMIATVIRSYYGQKFKRQNTERYEKENPVVFIGMALWGVSLVLPLITAFSEVLEFADYQINIVLRIIGTIIFSSSLWMLWRSHEDLATNFSPSLFIQKQHVLVTTGVYQRIRHPMYLSFYMWTIGQALIIDNWLAGPVGIIAFTMIYVFRVKREEQQLIDQFGEEYTQYMRKTERLVPRYLSTSYKDKKYF